MDPLEHALFQTFDKSYLSKQDKQIFKKLLDEQKPNEHKKAWLRSRIFDWANESLQDGKSQQVLAWLEEVNKLLSTSAKADIEEQVYFSPGDACLQAINGCLTNAVHSVDICVFTISDNRITEQIKACHRFGKTVRIITDNEKLYDAGSDIKELAQAGIPIRIDRTSNHMHHKFAIIDSRIVLTGSYNWTRSAAEYNHENILVTNHSQVVHRFIQEFEKMWQELEVYPFYI